MAIENFTIDNISRVVSSFARNQYFLIEINDLDKNHITMLARSTEIPATTHTTVDIPFRGVNVKFLGVPSFSEWSVQFLCDENHTIRNTFLDWQRVAYETKDLLFRKSNYKKSAKVRQIGGDGVIATAAVEFHGLFPSNVGPVAFDQTGGSFCTFDVSFSYDYHEKIGANQ